MRQLNEIEMRSLVGLLDDEDPGSLALVRERILGLGDTVLPFLEEAQAKGEPRLRRRVDSLIFEARFQHLERGFLALASQPEPDLETGAFLIARFGYPHLDEAKYVAWLDRAAAEAGPPKPRENSYPLLHRLNLLLFERMAFCGNEKNYYDPDNSFLNRVIETRQGIPITLSVLYILLGRRLGLPVAGAGLPGHYMVRYEPSPRRALFIDAFHKGRLLTRSQCKQLLLRSGYQFREEFLERSSDRDTLARIMRNLISIYQKSGASAKAEQMSTLVEILLTRRPAGGHGS